MIGWLIAWTMGIFLGLNALALVLSYVLIAVRPNPLRIQARHPVVKTLNGRLPLIALNIFIISTLTIGSLYSLQGIFVYERPAVLVLLLQALFVSVADDFFFYFIHRLLHENKFLYRKIHRIHHRAYTPVPIEYIYVHPLEWLMGLTGVLVGFGTLIAVGGGLNVWTFLLYSFLRQFHELDIHSGLRSVLGKKFPFWGTTEHHDLHHAKPTLGNYAASYTFWDSVFGTRVERES